MDNRLGNKVNNLISYICSYLDRAVVKMARKNSHPLLQVKRTKGCLLIEVNTTNFSMSKPPGLWKTNFSTACVH